MFNIFSLNLMLTDCTEFNCIFPFVVGAPVAIFWTVLSIFIPIKNTRFYSQFAFMPIALYDSSFYDGLGFQPNNTSVHPFAKAFMPENSFFDHTFIILIILVISASKSLLFSSWKSEIKPVRSSSCANHFLVLHDCVLLQAEERSIAHEET